MDLCIHDTAPPILFNDYLTNVLLFGSLYSHCPSATACLDSDNVVRPSSSPHQPAPLRSGCALKRWNTVQSDSRGLAGWPLVLLEQQQLVRWDFLPPSHQLGLLLTLWLLANEYYQGFCLKREAGSVGDQMWGEHHDVSSTFCFEYPAIRARVSPRRNVSLAIILFLSNANRLPYVSSK